MKQTLLVLWASEDLGLPGYNTGEYVVPGATIHVTSVADGTAWELEIEDNDTSARQPAKKFVIADDSPENLANPDIPDGEMILYKAEHWPRFLHFCQRAQVSIVHRAQMFA